MTSLYGAKAGVNASSAPPLSSSSTNWTAESPPPEASITSLTFSRWNVARAGVANAVAAPNPSTTAIAPLLLIPPPVGSVLQDATLSPQSSQDPPTPADARTASTSVAT